MTPTDGGGSARSTGHGRECLPHLLGMIPVVQTEYERIALPVGLTKVALGDPDLGVRLSALRGQELRDARLGLPESRKQLSEGLRRLAWARLMILERVRRLPGGQGPHDVRGVLHRQREMVEDVGYAPLPRRT